MITIIVHYRKERQIPVPLLNVRNRPTGAPIPNLLHNYRTQQLIKPPITQILYSIYIQNIVSATVHTSPKPAPPVSPYADNTSSPDPQTTPEPAHQMKTTHPHYEVKDSATVPNHPVYSSYTKQLARRDGQRSTLEMHTIRPS